MVELEGRCGREGTPGLGGGEGRTPSREAEAMGMGDKPPSYSASNSMVTFILSKIAFPRFSFSRIQCQVVNPDPRMSVAPSFRHPTHKGGEGARAERNMAVGFKAVELVGFLFFFS